MKTLIKNGLLVQTEFCMHADLLIDDERIVVIAPHIKDDRAEIYDAEGCMVFPGFIDAHTHLDMDTPACHTADDFSSGSRAALMGGVTTVLDFATQEKKGSLKAALAAWHDLAKEKAWCDYGFHMAITDWNKAIAAELPKLIEEGVSSFKVYMAYKQLRLSDTAIYELSRRLRLMGGLLMFHCENGDLVESLAQELFAEGRRAPEAHAASRPAYAEAEAVVRALVIAEAAGTVPYIVHLSSERALEAARAARFRGQKVWLETCPQYLFLEEAMYQQEFAQAAKYVCSPPLRSSADKNALWQAMLHGEMDVVSTDHCSFNMAGQKSKGLKDFRRIPNGLPGVEHRPLLLYSYGVSQGKLSPSQLAMLAAENPARIFGLYPRKGVLRAEADADIVIIEPDAPYTIEAASQWQNVDYTPYEGMELTARIRAVWLRGELMAEEGRLLAKRPGGQYLARGPSAGV
ncbi:MAG: dihydropyrimidinase [Firmicutes bacterium]|nr:dihydropyrimidinase [Bacillota bacterium]